MGADLGTETEALLSSWELALDADGYSRNTLISYLRAVRRYAEWLAANVPDRRLIDTTRDDLRRWLVELRATANGNTGRAQFAGVRHFFRWLVAEDEIDVDPTLAIRGPSPGQAVTPVLSKEDMQALLATCAGRGFVNRRDGAMLRVFLDGGLRLAEVAGLATDDVNVRERIIQVHGKGSQRSGPRHRVVPVGVKTAQALDRYMRERARHPHASNAAFWLGDRGRGPISQAGVEAVIQRRAAAAGLEGLHPHMLRHTWAHEFRAAGGSEGDLMLLGGWRSRQMLDRYGASAASGRAREAYQRLSLGDRL